MSDQSAIQWTDATWNPTTGCTKISPGCANCYIERTPPFRINGRKFVNGATDLQLHANRLEQPLHWRKSRRVFVNSLSDLFHPDVPDAFIARVFATMALTPRHTFQVLTKRAERMRDYMRAVAADHHAERVHQLASEMSPSYFGCFNRWWPLPNVWLGVSVENQRFADERIPLLLQTPAAVRFISAEPLLGPVSLYPQWLPAIGYQSCFPRLDWVIVGGESGPRSRPFDVAWARSILQQCQTAGVPVFVKQLGANPICRNDERDERWPGCTVPIDDDYEPRYQGDDAPLVFRDKKGGDITEWPLDLRVREFPNATSIDYLEDPIMDGQPHTDQSQSHASNQPKDLSFNFGAIFGTLLANHEVRAWLHHLMDTALDNLSKVTQPTRGPEGTVIWGTKHGQVGVAPDVTVPDVMGKTKTQATSTLENAGLNGTFTGPDAGHVSAQDPQAGATLTYGDYVNVTLS